MRVHVHRQTGCQAIVTTWQQPTAFHFWLRQALQLQKQALPEAPSFPLNRWDGWATSSDTHTHTRAPFPLLSASGAPASLLSRPAQLLSKELSSFLPES